jgi:uncharacterized DUF497 family protein
VRFIFDSRKDKLNLAKHGLSLSFAEKLAWDEAYISLRLAERREVKKYVESTQ